LEPYDEKVEETYRRAGIESQHLLVPSERPPIADHEHDEMFRHFEKEHKRGAHMFQAE